MKGQRLLIVDDDPDIRSMLADVLTALGYEVEVFADGSRAWRRFEASASSFAAVVTDLKMPGISGDRLVRKLRKCRPDLPILVVTSSVGDRRLRDIAELPAVEIVAKPDLHDELEPALDRVMSGRELKSQRMSSVAPGHGNRRQIRDLLMRGLVAIGIGVPLVLLVPWPLPSPPDLPGRSETNVKRGFVLEVESPRGQLAEPPAAFRWGGSKEARIYRFRLWRGANELVFEAETGDVLIELPTRIRETLEPAVTYRWSVTGIDRDEHVIAETALTTFRVSPRSRNQR